MRRLYSDERGFTLPEIMVVTGVMLVLAIVAVSLLRPVSYEREMLDGQRRTDVAQIAQALKRYKADNGQFPSNIPADETTIGANQSQYGLCPLLVPKYLKDIPLDPEAGSKYKLGDSLETKEACSAGDVVYSANYSLRRDDQGAVIVSAPSAKLGKIEIVVK